MYKRALALAPNHPNTLCNYAVGGDGRARGGSVRLPALKFIFEGGRGGGCDNDAARGAGKGMRAHLISPHT